MASTIPKDSGLNETNLNFACYHSPEAEFRLQSLLLGKADLNDLLHNVILDKRFNELWLLKGWLRYE